MKTLVLVDIQDGFWENASKVQKELRAIIKNAIKSKQKIVVLELTVRNYGRTHETFRSLLDKLGDNVCYAEKYGDDGSNEVIEAMKEHDWDTSDGFEVAGVNLCYCVQDTAISLSQEHDVELLLDGCACWDHCSCFDNKKQALVRYEKNGVRINGNL